MKKYRFELIEKSFSGGAEKDQIMMAQSITDAIEKFVRKYDLEAPAYWDEPAYDRSMEIILKERRGTLKYLLSW